MYGQTSLGTRTTGAGATQLNGPIGVTTDSAGNLYVAESGNNRVLENMPGSAGTTPPPPNSVNLVTQLPAPERIVDTRIQGYDGPIASGQTRCFTLAGAGGIPSDAAAVVLNMTAVGHTTQGWITAYPAGQPVPATSSLNFDPSDYAVANGLIVRTGPAGQVCVEVGTVNSLPGSSDVVLDVTAYLSAANATQLPMLGSPQRVADTRQTADGPIPAGQTRCFSVAGRQAYQLTQARRF